LDKQETTGNCTIIDGSGIHGLNAGHKGRNLADQILWDIGGHKHINEMKTINADNQGSIALAKNPTFHARTKHIDIQYHFIRHHIEAENIFLQYCPTEDMTADPLTKGLARPAHERHIQAMGLGSRFATLSESRTTDLRPPNI
jgi:hypothetical protein